MRISDWSSDVCSSDLLAESPLPLSMQNEFARLNGSETRLFGELLDRPIRVYNSPGSAALKAAEEDNRQAERSEERGVGKECGSTCSARWSPDKETQHSTV